MSKKPIDTKSTVTKGKKFAIDELKKRGAVSIEEKKEINRKILQFIDRSGKQYKLIVKSKTAGTWQGTTADGNVTRIKQNTFWLFVDLSVKNPRYFIVPDDIMRKDIEKTHKEYLLKHQGNRPRNEDSTHHAIEEKRISQWEGRWDLIGLKN